MSNKLGRFEILGEIARSEIGSVLKALDPESGQTIALKTIRLQMLAEQSSSVVQQILQEAAGAKSLASHNIAQLYGAEEIDEQFCAAMEYVQGNSVATMLARNEGFSIWDLLDIARQACQGLDHARTHGVVHYSFEPSKIMVTWDGTVKILSYGISCMSTFCCPVQGVAPQIVHYMPPEQMQGEPMDSRSNIFSLGAILYEMLTEQKAFPGANVDEISEQVLQKMPAPPDQVNRKVLPALSAVIMKALAKSPEARHQSGQELVNELEQCKEGTARKSAPSAKSRSTAATTSATPAETSKMKAAAAAASWDGASQKTSISAVSAGLPQRGPENSIAAQEPETSTSSVGFAADPMMDKSKPAKSGPSFSEISELPPLKETYTAPAPPPESIETPAPPKAPVKPETRPRVQPRQVAKNAVTEIKKTPSRLFAYSIAAAVGLIALVVVGIAFRIRSENPEPENSVRPAAQVAQATSEAQEVPAQSAHAAANPDDEGPEVVTITSRPARKKPKAAAAPVAPVVVPGQLTVNSTPEGAELKLDGRSDPSWITPFNMTGLAPGQHTINVSKPGYVSENRTIEAASGSKVFLVVQLAPAGATVSVVSQPAGAAIFMDGHDTGKVTPAQLIVEKSGTHTFAVRKQGFLEEAASANLQAGQTFHLSPTLKPLGSTDEIKVGGRFKKIFGGGETAGMGAVVVKTSPKGAQVAVNNRVVDKPAPVEFYLNPGNYVIDITMSGFKSIHRVITVEKSGKVTMEETMERE
jgi:eukaryotic-like serine/threonine-protein kinase